MAYANAPASSSASSTWLTSRKNALIFSGDYREHLHLENPDSNLYKNQLNLPSLPIATLEQSAKIYLQSIEPLTTSKQYLATKAAVNEFLKAGGRGQELQKRLEKRASELPNSSWLQEWWNKGSYLEYREPVVIFVSYFFHFADLPMGYRGNQITRAAALLQGALKYRQMICQEKDMNTGAICATPFKYLFNSCRVPVAGSDQSVIYPASDSRNNHVVVIHKRQFFSFVATENETKQWEPKSLKELTRQLQTVRQLAYSGMDAPAVGGFCGGHRDAWSTAREQMIQDGNQSFLEAVQSAILIVCLDDKKPSTREEVGRALWHGDCRDRWYDKTVELVIFGNGKAGLMGEHSQFDGQVSVGLADYCLKYEREVIQNVHEWGTTNASNASNVSIVNHSIVPPTPLSTLIAWSSASKWNLNNIMNEFHDLVTRHDLSTVTFRMGGKKMIKKFKISPDAFAQLAVQLAYYRMFGTTRATYEPLSMRAFRHGRTETVRVVSNASKAWCESMDVTSTSSNQKLHLLRQAGNAHVTYIKTAAKGNACDRHLWGLRKCIGPNETMPLIFQDPTYWKTSTWHISTSNLSNDLFDGWGWGEVIPDGLGVAYSTNSDVLLYNVTSARGFSQTFCTHIEAALLDMCVVCMEGESNM